VTTTAKAPAATATTDPPAYRWRWVALFVILAAEVMDLLDALATTIAGPTIRAEIGGSESLIQWLAAGYTLAMAVGLITGGVIAGFGIAMAGGLAQRHGRAVMRGGLAVMAAASAGFAVIVHGTGAPGIWSLVPALAGYGIGMGLVMAPFFDIILAGVAPEESGSASGTLNAVQQFSGALGVAALGTLFFDQPGFGPGIQVVLWACVGLLALTFVLSALLPRRAREEVSA
jgi:MFS family permease